MNRNGTVEVCNRAVQDLLGVSHKMLHGKALAAIAAGDVIRTALKSGLSTHGVEDIATRRVSVSVVPVLREHKFLRGYLRLPGCVRCPPP